MSRKYKEDVRKWVLDQRCKTCKKLKPWDDFYKHKAYKSGHYRECKTCADKRGAKNAIKNPDMRLSANIKKFGITVLDYKKIYAEQHGNCAICGKSQSNQKQRMCIDHSHKTGKVRGLLCTHCNKGLGMFEDSIDVLLSAVSYLKNEDE